jgi:hypothetical protein
MGTRSVTSSALPSEETRTMTAVVRGIYREGKIELLETPAGLREGRVRLILMEEPDTKPEPQYLIFGKYSGGPDVTLEDLEGAEWHGEPEFDDLRSE